MASFDSERELMAVALALAGAETGLSEPERRIVASCARAPATELVASTRAAICAGEDPLGDALMALRSQAKRREAGAVYTPAPIIDAMLAWAEREGRPARVVDPGVGSGRFLVAAARRFPQAALIGIELDPAAALLLRANLAVQGLSRRATVLVQDFRAAPLPTIDGATLFIGNPPYLRHHDIAGPWKAWYAAAAAEFGVRASKLAGLHLHFFLRTLQLGRKGDFGAFITAAEWLDVNYGAALRRLLGERLGGVALHVLEPAVAPFAGTLTTGAITCFRVDRQPEAMRVHSVPSLAALDGLSAGTPVAWKDLRRAPRWSTIIRPTPAPPAGFIELGELCRVSRGQVTGGNAIWIAGEAAKDLPDRVLRPTVTRARELIAAPDTLTATGHLRRVVDLPVDLDALDAGERRRVDRFLAWAKAQGGAESYIARHRRAWWSVSLYPPAPILCTYMARRVPAFVRNLCNARHLNIAHGLYPREALDEPTLAALLAHLCQHVRLSSGRTYAGGLTKFEPKELERIAVPTLEMLRKEADPLVHGTRPSRCGRQSPTARDLTGGKYPPPLARTC